MPSTRKRQPLMGPEDFFFEVAEWDFGHSMWTHLDKSTRRLFGPVSAHVSLTLRGPIRSHTKRKIDRGQLEVWPSGAEPKDWPKELETVGVILSLRGGLLHVVHQVTEPAFQRVLAVAATGRLVEFSVTVRDLKYRQGKVVGVRISTEDTDADDVP